MFFFIYREYGTKFVGFIVLRLRDRFRNVLFLYAVWEIAFFLGAEDKDKIHMAKTTMPRSPATLVTATAYLEFRGTNFFVWGVVSI